MGASEVVEDEAVLRTVLGLHCIEGSGVEMILSSKPYAPQHTDPSLMAPFGGLSNSLIANLIARSRRAKSLPGNIECRNIRVVEDRLITGAIRQPVKRSYDHPVAEGSPLPIKAGTAFRDMFPEATILARLSLPAYSSSRDVAVVYMYEECGGACMFERYFLLRKIGEEWRVILQESYKVWDFEGIKGHP